MAPNEQAGDAGHPLNPQPVVEHENDVVILAGGSGSGKGAILEHYLNNLQEAGEKLPHAIWDTTLSHYDSARRRINQALDAEKDVTIIYVHRPIELAAQGVVRREILTGRSVPEDFIATAHYGAQQSIFKLQKDFEQDPRVSIVVFDNSGTIDDLSLDSIETTLGPIRYTSREEVAERLGKAMSDARSEARTLYERETRTTSQTRGSREPDRPQEPQTRGPEGSRGAEEARKAQGPLIAAQQSGSKEEKPQEVRSAFRRMSVTKTLWELEPIARGTSGGFNAKESAIAKDLVKLLSRNDVKPNLQLNVKKNWHEQLRNEGQIRRQVRGASDTTFRRAQEQEQNRNPGLER